MKTVTNHFIFKRITKPDDLFPVPRWEMVSDGDTATVHSFSEALARDLGFPGGRHGTKATVKIVVSTKR